MTACAARYAMKRKRAKIGINSRPDALNNCMVMEYMNEINRRKHKMLPPALGEYVSLG